MSKNRITILPWVGFKVDRKIPPCMVTHTQGSTFKLKKRILEKVKVQIDNETVEVKRYRCLTFSGVPFYLYHNARSYVYTPIFQAEGKRVSIHLRKHYPGTNFVCILDNASMHKKIQNFENLKFVFLQPGTTSMIQPLDLIFNGALKQKYKKNSSMQL